MGVEAVGVLEQETTTDERWHAGAEDLAVERMGKRHRLPPTVGANRQQPGPIEQLELVAADDVLQRRQARRLPHRQPIERIGGRRRQRSEAGGDDLLEARRGDERTNETPHTVLADEVTTVDGAEHQLAHEQHVAATGRPDLGDRGRLDRTVQDEVQERVDCGPIEVVEIDAADASPVPQRVQPGRAAAVGPDGGDEEHEVGVDQLPDERRRRRVQELQIVDEQHERTVQRLRPQHRPHLRHHGHQIIAFVADAGRQQVGQRPERDRP